MSKKSPPSPFDPVAFGERIKRRRAELGLLQAALAERAELQVSALSPYENGLRLPSDPAILVNLARALEVSVDWLLTGRVGPMSPTEAQDYERGRDDAFRGVLRYLAAEMKRPAEAGPSGVVEDFKDGPGKVVSSYPGRGKLGKVKRPKTG